MPPDTDTRGVPTTQYDSGDRLQARGIAYPDRTPVGMTQLRDYLIGSHGGANLGILAKPPRSMRASDQPSLHNWGIALDWNFASPGPGRAGADAVIAFLLDHRQALNIQAIHDYSAGRYWKSYADWKPGTPSADTGMGQTWAQWLHIERTWDAANDQHSIETLLGGAPTNQPTVTTPAANPMANPATDQLPTGPLKLDSRGADVARVQDFLRAFGFAQFSQSDGVYGPKTQAAVIEAQQKFAQLGTYTAAVDGEWGPKTAAAAQQYRPHD